MYPHPHRPFSRGANNRYVRLLLVVMPGSLLITWMWKQYEMVAPREREWPEAESDAISIRRVVYWAPPDPQCNDDERAALRRLGLWNESGTENCCLWSGVKCTGGHVTGLTLSGGKASGTVPAQLCQLRQLAVLDLNENPRLSGTLPTQLGRMSSLTHLYLFGSALSGTIPELGGCKALQELEMSHCRLSGTLPPSLGAASKLKFVFLESNKLSGTLPTSLSRLGRLHELELSENKISGTVPAALRAMPLQHLDLQHNPRLSGAAETRASSQSDCSGGAAKYLRGGQTPPKTQTTASFPYKAGPRKGGPETTGAPK